MTTVHNEEEVLIELIEEYSVASVDDVNVGDVDVLVGVSSTFATVETGQTDIVEVSTGEPGDGAGYKIVAQPTPPTDTSFLWLDTSP